MNDQAKTNAELIEEISSLKQRTQELEQFESKRKRADKALRESEALQSTLLANLPAGVVIIDPVTRMIENVNNTAAAMFGVQAEYIVGHRCHAFLCPASEGACPVCDLGKEVDNAEREMVCANGSRRPVLKSVKRVQVRGQEKLLECFVDITAQKRAEEALRGSEDRYRSLVENASDVIFKTDLNGNFTFVNPAVIHITGYEEEEIIGRQYTIMIRPDMRDNALKFFGRQFVKGLKNTYSEYPIITKDGQELWLGQNTQLIMEDGHVVGFQVVARDISERKRTEEALRESEQRYRELSTVDGLTQLYNSRHFYNQLKMEIDRVDRYGQPFTLLLLDLDDFKQFNDTYGHIEGDQVLARFGQVVKRCLRQTDSAYRYGGEEFTILLPMTTIGDGAVTAERIRAVLKEEIFSPVSGQGVHMTVSIGLAQYKPQEDMKTFVSRVDQLMYQAKKSGKDRVCPESY
jgi:diguanylate cyclase (GGDEF)-like protein/PAS domain S-box-containing protein